MKKLLFILIAFTSLVSFAQTGNLQGAIQDKEYAGNPLPFADVYVKGTTKGSSTDFDGNYTIQGVPVGTHTIVVSFVGYETKEIPNVVIKSGETTYLNTELGADANALKEIIITAAPKVKETESALIEEQKEAVVITQTIGAEELAKKGVSNAEAAVTKVAGITKSQGSKSVFVRGLGDRYNSTTLNGLPLPSDDPESKNISLDFFSSNVISNIGVNKTFNPSIYGDVGGANIDIKSKKITKNSLSLSSSLGFNSQTIGKKFLRISGTNDWGTGIIEKSPITDKTLSTYNFDNSLNTEIDNFPLNSSISIVAGGKIQIGKSKLKAFVVGSNKRDFKYKEGTSGSINSTGNVIRKQDFEKYDYNTSQLLMGGLNLDFGRHSIGLTHLYIHNNTQSVGEYEGINTSVSDDGFNVFTRRQQLNDNDLYVNQLNTHFEITDRLDVDFGSAFNYISANEPDRKTNTFIQSENGDFLPAQGSAGLNNRFYSELQEDDYAAKLEAKYDLNYSNEIDYVRSIKAGFNFRYTKRNFIFRQFNQNIINQSAANINDVDSYFNQDNLDNGDFTLVTDRGLAVDSFGRSVSQLFPFFYFGNRTTESLFVDGVYQINEVITLNGGLRYDEIEQEVDYDTTLVSSINGTTPDDTAKLNKQYWLPSINIKFSPLENLIFRAAGSISYTLPQLREVAPFTYEGINFSTIGNPDIDASKNYNLDLKSEFYFGETESNLITLTTFYKHLDNPINRVRSNSATGDLTFVNVPKANVFGLEVEFKYNLLEDDLKGQQLSFGFNGAYLYSEQIQEDNPNDNYTIRFTHDKDQLQGASPVLINGDITYQKETDKLSFTTSLIGNYFSERIFSVGTAGNENIVESSIFSLDFINKLTINKKIGISLNLKNLSGFIDILGIEKDWDSVELTQETSAGEKVTLNSYKRGVDFSAGFSYKF